MNKKRLVKTKMKLLTSSLHAKIWSHGDTVIKINKSEVNAISEIVVLRHLEKNIPHGVVKIQKIHDYDIHLKKAKMTLMDLWKNEKLNFRRAIHIYKQLAMALWRIHESGVWHRDIKEQNILVHDNDRIEFIDFGSAISNASKKYSFDYYNVITTATHESPETRKGSYSKKIDVFALGIVFAQMICRRFLIIGDYKLARKRLLENNSERLVRALKKRKATNYQIELIVGMTQPNPKKRMSTRQVVCWLGCYTEIPKPVFAQPSYNCKKVLRGNRKQYLGILYGWLADVCQGFKFCNRTFYLTRRIIDYYWQINPIKENNRTSIQANGLAALYIANLLINDDLIEYCDLQHICKNAYTKQELKKTIQNMLETLSYNVLFYVPPIPNTRRMRFLLSIPKYIMVNDIQTIIQNQDSEETQELITKFKAKKHSVHILFFPSEFRFQKKHNLPHPARGKFMPIT